jgi:hypothetical protein
VRSRCGIANAKPSLPPTPPWSTKLVPLRAMTVAAGRSRGLVLLVDERRA